MKNLLKIIFGSCLGTLIALAFLIFFMGGVVGNSIMKQFEKQETKVKANSVLSIKLGSQIPERTNNVPGVSYTLLEETVYGVFDICNAIAKAKDDPKIKGIYISEQYPGLGFVKAEEIRKALLDFKESGKFVYSYSNYLSNTAYYLASVSDEIMLHPLGLIDLRGFGSIVTYYTDFFEQIGVDMEVYYAGKYKSFTEPYRRTSMSEENRTQLHGILDQIYTTYVEELATARGVSVDAMKEAINDFDGSSATSAEEHGLIDRVGYSDEMGDIIRENLDLEEDDDINFVSLDDYADSIGDDKDYSVKDKIAVVYAEGSIGGNSNQNGQITGDPFVKALRDIRKEDKIKAVVLRVNSGGGDALISDRIWREFDLIRKEGKPVVVSMGNYAASGGYYIASASDHIFADDKTITGSIGVFSMIPNISKLQKDKLKIYTDTVRTADYAAGFLPNRERTAGEKEIFQSSVDHIYSTFLDRVAQNRDMTKEAVNEIAQGRVWTGLQGIEVGLVDEIGTLQNALDKAAELAELEDYRTSDFPKLKSPYESLLDQLQGNGMIESQIKSKIVEKFPVSEQFLNLDQFSTPQARLDVQFDFN